MLSDDQVKELLKVPEVEMSKEKRRQVRKDVETKKMAFVREKIKGKIHQEMYSKTNRAYNGGTSKGIVDRGS